MKRYRVERVVTEGYKAFVEADSEEDAEKLMEDLEEDDWDLMYCDETLREVIEEVEE